MKGFEVSKLQRMGDAPFFVFADHASRVIPEELNCLGMPDDLLETHIAWDIGAGALAIALGEALGCTVFSCTFSRLVVDVNRDKSASDFIPAVSDQIPVPGNQMLSDADRRHRISKYYDPYHDELSAAIDEFTERVERPFVISVHSFTKRLMGAAEDRPWQMGLLWREDEKSARAVANHVEKNAGWTVGDNEPYDARVFNYSIDRHVGSRGLSHVTFELRQDIICDQRGVAEAALILAEAVKDAAATG